MIKFLIYKMLNIIFIKLFINKEEVLIDAAINGNIETVKLFLDMGANIHADNNEALRCASEYGHTEIVKLLLNRGADVYIFDNCAIRCAAEYGHAETVKVLKKYMKKNK